MFEHINTRALLQEHDLRCIDMYLMEYTSFSDCGYVGPAVFLPQGGAKASPVPSKTLLSSI